MRSRFPLLWAQAGVAGLLALWGLLQIGQGGPRSEERPQTQGRLDLASAERKDRGRASADPSPALPRRAGENPTRPQRGAPAAEIRKLPGDPLIRQGSPTSAPQLQGDPQLDADIGPRSTPGASQPTASSPLGPRSESKASQAAPSQSAPALALLRAAEFWQKTRLRDPASTAVEFLRAGSATAQEDLSPRARPEWAAWAVESAQLALLGLSGDAQGAPPAAELEPALSEGQPRPLSSALAAGPRDQARGPSNSARPAAPAASATSDLLATPEQSGTSLPTDRIADLDGSLRSSHTALAQAAPSRVAQPPGETDQGSASPASEATRGLVDPAVAQASRPGGSVPEGSRRAASASSPGSAAETRIPASVQVSDASLLAERARGEAHPISGSCEGAAGAGQAAGSVRFVLTVTDRRGTPLPGQTIEVLLGEGQSPLVLQADERGQVALALDPGRYRLRRPGQPGDARARLTVREGLRSVELEL
jgi:hypothetical protein